MARCNTADDLYRKMLMNMHADQISMYFDKMKVLSNTDRVAVAYNNITNYKLLPYIEKNEKNDSLSQMYRKEGNILYIKDKKFNNAFELYNKSVAFAEINSDCLSIAYANRSAVLFELGYFEECLKDIEKALLHNFPAKMRPKLIIRQERANKLITKTKKFQYCNDILELSHDRNEEIECASVAVDINYSDKYGRHIIATEDLSAGDVIAIDTPYCKILENTALYLNCNYCFTRSLNMIPCDKCNVEMFCDDQCKNNAWDDDLHPYKCELASSLYTLEQSAIHSSLILTLKALNDNTIVETANLDDKRTKCGYTIVNSKYKYITDSYNTVSKFLINEKIPKMGRLIGQVAFYAAILQYLLEQKCSDIFVKHSKEHVIELLFRNILITLLIGCSVNELGNEEFELYQRKREPIGDSICTFYGLINHSCDPNIRSISYGALNALRVLRPIKKGEQLFVSYYGNYGTAMKEIRQQQLRLQFMFDCECPACVKDWPYYDLLPSNDYLAVNFIYKVLNDIKVGKLDTAIKKITTILNAVKNQESPPKIDYIQWEYALTYCFDITGNKFISY